MYNIGRTVFGLILGDAMLSVWKIVDLSTFIVKI